MLKESYFKEQLKKAIPYTPEEVERITSSGGGKYENGTTIKEGDTMVWIMLVVEDEKDNEIGEREMIMKGISKDHYNVNELDDKDKHNYLRARKMVMRGISTDHYNEYELDDEFKHNDLRAVPIVKRINNKDEDV